ncbi:MAG TPA: phosphotransferase, partial [Streptosporangiaceae bacterium]|nr:phosphotransferase [Streptosporangiaceae bacterium]
MAAALPGLGRATDSREPRRQPPATVARARALLSRAATDPAVLAALASLTPTLLHGDVHPGNVLVTGHRATLIDWGSSRVGPAMLDLANLAAPGP